MTRSAYTVGAEFSNETKWMAVPAVLVWVIFIMVLVYSITHPFVGLPAKP